MRVAVIGGGLFGCTAAIHASRAGHIVHLYETKPRLMAGATSACYYRLHRGYHYPRSPETGRESREAEASFRREYGEAVIDGGRQLYGVAREGSKVSPLEFRRFMDEAGLPYRVARDDRLDSLWLFELEEPRIEAMTLMWLVTRTVEASDIEVYPNMALKGGRPIMVGDLRQRYDRIIIAAYAGTNFARERLDIQPQRFKYQVVEKPIVRLPSEFVDFSLVVIDGPFGCIDPHLVSDLHALGHVTETVHAENVGTAPDIPAELAPLIEAGVLRTYEGIVDKYSRVDRVLEAMSVYVPTIKESKHVGSMFTVRALLPDMEETDARPTVVERLDDQVIQIFSGKLGTAVKAAEMAVGMLEHAVQTAA